MKQRPLITKEAPITDFPLHEVYTFSQEDEHLLSKLVECLLKEACRISWVFDPTASPRQRIYDTEQIKNRLEVFSDSFPYLLIDVLSWLGDHFEQQKSVWLLFSKEQKPLEFLENTEIISSAHQEYLTYLYREIKLRDKTESLVEVNKHRAYRASYLTCLYGEVTQKINADLTNIYKAIREENRQKIDSHNSPNSEKDLTGSPSISEIKKEPVEINKALAPVIEKCRIVLLGLGAINKDGTLKQKRGTDAKLESCLIYAADEFDVDRKDLEVALKNITGHKKDLRQGGVKLEGTIRIVRAKFRDLKLVEDDSSIR